MAIGAVRFTPWCNGAASPPQLVPSDLVPLSFPLAGESGLGKSTLVNSLFLTDLYRDRKLLSAEGKKRSMKRSRAEPGGLGSPAAACRRLACWRD